MNVKELREMRGWTQAQMSLITTIPIRTIQNWEEGKRTPPKWVEKLLIYYLLHA